MKKHSLGILAIALFAAPGVLFAASQHDSDEKKKEIVSSVSGSLESNNIDYVKDNVTTPNGNPPKYGSNNYLKVDFTRGRFGAGIQAEYYPKVIEGYETALKGYWKGFYLSWTDKNYSITAGDLYDQFGSGLILRAYEDRTLGINNSIGGVRFTYNLNDWLAVKVLAGVPRDYMQYADSWLVGADLSLSLSNLIGMKEHSLALEGSFVNKNEAIPDEYAETFGDQAPGSNLQSFSARLNYEWRDLYAKFEYVGKGKDLMPGEEILKSGDAQYLEVGYNVGGFAATAMFRRLNNMTSMIYHPKYVESPMFSNTMNYMPSLTPQHGYSLAMMHPFTTFAPGEIGGQIDLYYNVRKGTALGGKRGLKLHANYAQYHTVDGAVSRPGSHFLYREVSGDIDKQWRKWRMILFVSIQEYSPSHGVQKMTAAQNAFAADITYKITPKTSLRAELQYLYSEEYDKDWMAGMLELNFAPHWSIFASDMYNSGETKVHYYSAGMSYSHSHFRVAVNYGRNRAGFVCSGGVCRFSPAYTGANIQLTATF